MLYKLTLYSVLTSLLYCKIIKVDIYYIYCIYINTLEYRIIQNKLPDALHLASWVT